MSRRQPPSLISTVFNTADYEINDTYLEAQGEYATSNAKITNFVGEIDQQENLQFTNVLATKRYIQDVNKITFANDASLVNSLTVISTGTDTIFKNGRTSGTHKFYNLDGADAENISLSISKASSTLTSDVINLNSDTINSNKTTVNLLNSTPTIINFGGNATTNMKNLKISGKLDLSAVTALNGNHHTDAVAYTVNSAPLGSIYSGYSTLIGNNIASGLQGISGNNHILIGYKILSTHLHPATTIKPNTFIGNNIADFITATNVTNLFGNNTIVSCGGGLKPAYKIGGACNSNCIVTCGNGASELTTGSQNTYLGDYTGNVITTGSNNLNLGYEAGTANSQFTNVATTSNTMVLGNNNITDTYISGTNSFNFNSDSINCNKTTVNLLNTTPTIINFGGNATTNMKNLKLTGKFDFTTATNLSGINTSNSTTAYGNSNTALGTPYSGNDSVLIGNSMGTGLQGSLAGHIFIGNRIVSGKVQSAISKPCLYIGSWIGAWSTLVDPTASYGNNVVIVPTNTTVKPFYRIGGDASNNVFVVGSSSCNPFVNGTNNTALGDNVLGGLVSGSNNLCLGYESGSASSQFTMASATSNTTIIGNNSVLNTYISGTTSLNLNCASLRSSATTLALFNDTTTTINMASACGALNINATNTTVTNNFLTNTIKSISITANTNLFANVTNATSNILTLNVGTNNIFHSSSTTNMNGNIVLNQPLTLKQLSGTWTNKTITGIGSQTQTKTISASGFMSGNIDFHFHKIGSMIYGSIPYKSGTTETATSSISFTTALSSELYPLYPNDCSHVVIMRVGSNTRTLILSIDGAGNMTLENSDGLNITASTAYIQYGACFSYQGANSL